MTPREKWLKARLDGLGGSDIGAIMGVSPWASAYSVFAEKIGLVEPGPQTDRMKFGHLHEPTIAKWYADETGRKVYEADRANARAFELPVDVMSFGDGYWLYIGKNRPWERMTPDNLVMCEERGPGVLEKKCAAYGLEEWKNGPPAHYMLQLQAYLGLTGLKWGSFAVMFSMYSLGFIDVDRDDEMIERIWSASDDMWRRIQDGDPPQPDGSEASRKALDAVLGVPDDSIVTLPPDALLWDEEYVEACEDIKAAQRRKADSMMKIRAAMGNATVGALSSGVTWRCTHVEATDAKKSHRRYSRRDPI